MPLTTSKLHVLYEVMEDKEFAQDLIDFECKMKAFYLETKLNEEKKNFWHAHVLTPLHNMPVERRKTAGPILDAIFTLPHKSYKEIENIIQYQRECAVVTQCDNLEQLALLLSDVITFPTELITEWYLVQYKRLKSIIREEDASDTLHQLVAYSRFLTSMQQQYDRYRTMNQAGHKAFNTLQKGLLQLDAASAYSVNTDMIMKPLRDLNTFHQMTTTSTEETKNMISGMQHAYRGYLEKMMHDCAKQYRDLEQCPSIKGATAFQTRLTTIQEALQSSLDFLDPKDPGMEQKSIDCLTKFSQSCVGLKQKTELILHNYKNSLQKSITPDRTKLLKKLKMKKQNLRNPRMAKESDNEGDNKKIKEIFSIDRDTSDNDSCNDRNCACATHCNPCIGIAIQGATCSINNLTNAPVRFNIVSKQENTCTLYDQNNKEFMLQQCPRHKLWYFEHKDSKQRYAIKLSFSSNNPFILALREVYPDLTNDQIISTILRSIGKILTYTLKCQTTISSVSAECPNPKPDEK